MTDEVKKYTTPDAITQPVKLGSKLNSFHKQVAEGSKVQTPSASAPGVASFADMSTTVIFPDCSGSMSDIVGGGTYGSKNNEPRSKVQFCRDAINSYLDNCFAGASKVGIASFPEQVVVEPTPDLRSVKQACEALQATGGTPMTDPLDYVIATWPLTHGIVISDGCPDERDAVLRSAQAYKVKGVKLDAVHIGDPDEGGEALMKQIAEITGGIYIKFTDVKAFADSFKFLTPKHRLALTTSKNPVALLGASEVKL